MCFFSVSSSCGYPCLLLLMNYKTGINHTAAGVGAAAAAAAGAAAGVAAAGLLSASRILCGIAWGDACHAEPLLLCITLRFST